MNRTKSVYPHKYEGVTGPFFIKDDNEKAATVSAESYKQMN